MSHKISILWITLITFAVAPLFGQSAEQMDAVLAADPLSLGDAAYLAVMSSGRIPPEASAEQAIALLEMLAARAGHRDRFSERELDSDANLGEFSYMLMLAHDISGGFWYRRIPGPRYGLREMRYRRLVQGQSWALQPLEGERAMRIIGRVMALREGQ